jgi:cyclomaltodextrinase / maltogenic alpha-amylase / neopullulanase
MLAQHENGVASQPSSERFTKRTTMQYFVRHAQAHTCALLVALSLLTLGSGPSHAADASDSRPVARQSPEWLHDAVIYEVFPRAFSPTGDFKGVTAQMDRLKALGVNVLWLMPIHPMGKLKAKGTIGSPYAVRDYEGIDPAYGTADDLKQLVAAAHKRGMKVFIDVVANHTSWDSVLIKKHPEWFKRDARGQIVPPNPDWVDVAQLDYTNPELRRYMSNTLVSWLRDFDLDGFRCDYAAGIPQDFWEALRPQLDRVRPDLAFLAEAHKPELLHSAFDIDYAWDFYHALSAAIAGRTAASVIRTTWERDERTYPRGGLRLRFSDNHDQLRTTALAGLPAALAASALIFTLDGVPLLYNGMEVGDTTESTAPALFERVPIQWNMAERRPPIEQFYRSLASLRRAHPALTRGDVRWLNNADEERVVSFERVSGSESLIVVINLSSSPFGGIVDAGAGTFKDVTPNWEAASKTSQAPQTTQRAKTLPALFLEPWEFRVFSRATQ